MKIKLIFGFLTIVVFISSSLLGLLLIGVTAHHSSSDVCNVASFIYSPFPLIPALFMAFSGYVFSKLFENDKLFYLVSIPAITIGLLIYHKVAFGFFLKLIPSRYPAFEEGDLFLAVALEFYLPFFFLLGEKIFTRLAKH